MLVAIQYKRSDANLTCGRFRVRGDTLEVQQAYADTAHRIEFPSDEIECITEIDTLTSETLKDLPEAEIYPTKHYVTPKEKLQRAIREIEQELEERIAS